MCQKKIFVFTLLLIFSPVSYGLVEITPSDVYRKNLEIYKEIELIRKHFNSPKTTEAPNSGIFMRPRNTSLKCYEILVKINILRTNKQLPRVAEVVLQPLKEFSPGLVYEQMIRILAELHIIKDRIGVNGKIQPVKQQFGKTVSDNYHLLETISNQLDGIIGKSFTPSYVFAQNMRILEEINTILGELSIRERTSPPNRNEDAIPKDVFKVALQLLEEVKRLQRIAGVESIDLSSIKITNITPSDVFGLTGVIISELQPIKAYLRISKVTPAANIYHDKYPADVLQLMGWTLRKIKKIRTLN
ncbi:MAG: hypothetical protein L3J59_05600 [Methylococcaceae bacterium]|nr:hypothetical protein [Methylococcaceae bacterium]